MSRDEAELEEVEGAALIACAHHLSGQAGHCGDGVDAVVAHRSEDHLLQRVVDELETVQFSLLNLRSLLNCAFLS